MSDYMTNTCRSILSRIMNIRDILYKSVVKLVRLADLTPD